MQENRTGRGMGGHLAATGKSCCEGQLPPAQRAPCEPAGLFIVCNNCPILQQSPCACCCLLLGLFNLFTSQEQQLPSAPSPCPAPLLPGLVCVGPREHSSLQLLNCLCCSAVTDSPGSNPARTVCWGLCPSVCWGPSHSQTLPSSTGAISPPQTCREQVSNSWESAHVCSSARTALSRGRFAALTGGVVPGKKSQFVSAWWDAGAGAPAATPSLLTTGIWELVSMGWQLQVKGTLCHSIHGVRMNPPRHRVAPPRATPALPSVPPSLGQGGHSEGHSRVGGRAPSVPPPWGQHPLLHSPGLLPSLPPLGPKTDA